MHESSRAMREISIPSHDGKPLHCRRWPAAGTARGAIFLFHRDHEHGGAMARLVDGLALPDFDFFAWDAPGQGGVDRTETAPAGHLPENAGCRTSRASTASGDHARNGMDSSATVEDIEALVQAITRTHGIDASRIAVVAQGAGAALVSAWMHDFAPALRAAVLATPTFPGREWFRAPALAWLSRVGGGLQSRGEARSWPPTPLAGRVEGDQNDQLVASGSRQDEAAARVLGDAQAIRVPVQLLVSGKGQAAHHEMIHRFFVGLGSPIKECLVLEDCRDEVLGELGHAPVVRRVREFLLGRFEAPEPLSVESCGATTRWRSPQPWPISRRQRSGEHR